MKFLPSTFATKKTKARSSNIVERSDDVYTFTQATQGTYETRMVEFRKKIDEFRVDITSHIKKSEIQQQILASIQAQKKQNNMKQLQKTMSQMIQISLQQNIRKTMADIGIKNSTKSNITTKSNKSGNIAESTAKRKRKAVEILAQKKEKKDIGVDGRKIKKKQ